MSDVNEALKQMNEEIKFKHKIREIVNEEILSCTYKFTWGVLILTVVSLFLFLYYHSVFQRGYAKGYAKGLFEDCAVQEDMNLDGTVNFTVPAALYNKTSQFLRTEVRE